MSFLWMRWSFAWPLIGALCLTATGCHVTAPRQETTFRLPPESATVSTGGLFAQSMTLAIAAQGLTLSEAVEASLRPGLLDQQLVAGQIVASQTPRRHSPANRPAPTVDASVFVKQVLETRAEIGTGNHLDEAIRMLASNLRTGSGSMGQPASGDVEFQNKIIALINQHDDVISRPLANGRLTSEQQELASMVDAIARASGDATIPRESADEPVDLLSGQPASITVTSPLASAIVVLKRSGQANKLIPLPLVRSTPAGDILLQDRDRVEITSLARTNLGNRAALSGKQVDGQVTIAGLLSATLDSQTTRNLEQVSDQIALTDYRNVADLMVLKTSGLSGAAEEYWFPRSSHQLYHQLPLPDPGGIQLRSGDVVKVNVMDLEPIIRSSRLRSRMRRLEAINEDRFNTRLAKFRAAKAECEQEIVDKTRSAPATRTFIQNVRRIVPFP